MAENHSQRRDHGGVKWEPSGDRATLYNTATLLP
jgi:hypothetical protein